MEKSSNPFLSGLQRPFISIEAQAVLRQLLGNPDVLVRTDLIRLAEHLLETGTMVYRNDTYLLAAYADTMERSSWQRHVVRHEEAVVARFGRPVVPSLPPVNNIPEYRPLLPLVDEDEKEALPSHRSSIIASPSDTESDPPRLETSEELAEELPELEPSFEAAPEEEPELSRLMIIYRTYMEDPAKYEAFKKTIRENALTLPSAA